jgi:O-antigen ligase
VRRDGLAVRVGQARAELAAAVAGDLDSPTGARIAVMGAAWEAGVARPLGGAGAGSINAVATDRLGPDHAAAGLEHAHSMWLHWFGTLGVPGVVLGGLVFVTAVRGAWRAAGGLSGGSWLPRGVGFALVSLAVAGLFDAVLINMQTGALFGALAAVGCCGCGAEKPSGVTGRG